MAIQSLQGSPRSPDRSPDPSIGHTPYSIENISYRIRNTSYNTLPSPGRSFSVQNLSPITSPRPDSSTSLSDDITSQITASPAPKHAAPQINFSPSEKLTTRAPSTFSIFLNMIRTRFFSTHPLHDEKYKIALETQKNALNNSSQDISKLCNLIRDTKYPEAKAYYTSILQAIRALRDNSLSGVREQNKTYLTHLRAAISSPCYKLDKTIAKQILYRLCKAKFTENHMLAYHQEFATAADPNTRGITHCTQLAEKIEDTHEELKKSQHKKSRIPLAKQQLEGNEILSGADNMGKSNIPEVRSHHTYSTGKTVTSLRHGTAIISPEGKRIVAPEYLCFLDAQQEEGKHTLYINHQRASKEQKAGLFDQTEINRSEMLHKTENNYTHFHCLSLPMDGPLFNGIKKEDPSIGEGPKGEVKNVNLWKQSLLDAIAKDRLGFRFPLRLRFRAQANASDEFENTIKNILDFVQNNYFSNKTSFTKEERQQFLMICYFYIKEYAKGTLQADTIVTACKDNKDRGNASATIDEILLALHANQLNDRSLLQDIHDRFFGAFMIKREGIIEKRVKLVTGIAKRLGEINPDQIVEKYKTLFPNVPKPTEVRILQ